MPALTEIGQVGIMTGDGREYVLHPSLFNIAAIGSPEEIVSTYADLHYMDAELANALAQSGNTAAFNAYIERCHKTQATAAAIVILACGGDLELVGCYGEAGKMPDADQIIIARHLMQHGIVGKVKKSGGGGKYSPRFDASEYIDAARIHFGMSQKDAGELTMTQFGRMLDMKFPEQKTHEKPTQDDYRELERAIEEKRKAKNG